MNEDFRKRVFTPVVLPLAVVGSFLLYGFAVSRVLLAVSAGMASFIALAIASYILLVAGVVSARPRITSRALGIGMALGLVGVLAAGAAAGTAGMRDLHAEEEGGEGADGAEEGPPELPPGVPEDAALFVGVDIAYEYAPDSLPAGEITVAIENEGNIEHNVAFEGVNNGEPVAEADPGAVETGTVTLEPGDYTYFCDVAGHREAGMVGELTVEG